MIKWSVLPLWFFTLCVLGRATSTNIVEKDFFMRPGVDTQTVFVEHEGVICELSYKCSGGTGENWKLSLDVSQSDSIVCMIGRPNPPSYLLVNDFTASLDASDLSLQAVDIQAGGRSLAAEQYILAQNKVTPSSTWRGSMELIILKGFRASSPKPTTPDRKSVV